MKKKNIINKLIVAPLVMGFMSCTGNLWISTPILINRVI